MSENVGPASMNLKYHCGCNSDIWSFGRSLGAAASNHPPRHRHPFFPIEFSSWLPLWPVCWQSKPIRSKKAEQGETRNGEKKNICVIRCVCFAASVSRQTKLQWQPPASTCGLYSHACCWLDVLVYILLLAHLLPRYLVQPPEGLWLNAQQSSTEQDFGLNPTLTPKQKTSKDYSI